MPHCAKFHQNQSSGLGDIVFFDFSGWWRRYLGFLNFLYFIGWRSPEDWYASSIQISSKSVHACVVEI